MNKLEVMKVLYNHASEDHCLDNVLNAQLTSFWRMVSAILKS